MPTGTGLQKQEVTKKELQDKLTQRKDILSAFSSYSKTSSVSGGVLIAMTTSGAIHLEKVHTSTASCTQPVIHCVECIVNVIW